MVDGRRWAGIYAQDALDALYAVDAVDAGMYAVDAALAADGALVSMPCCLRDGLCMPCHLGCYATNAYAYALAAWASCVLCHQVPCVRMRRMPQVLCIPHLKCYAYRIRAASAIPLPEHSYASLTWPAREVWYTFPSIPIHV